MFNQETADAICKMLSEGKSLRTACMAEGMPDPATVLRWAQLEPFSQQYARAREIGYALLADEILEISDDGRLDTRTVGQGDSEHEVANTEWISRSKLRVDSRKWILAKMLPKVYGDKLAIGGDADNPLTVTVQRLTDKAA